MSHELSSEVDIALLMPKISDWHKNGERYGGLASSLNELGHGVVIVEGHGNYIGSGQFVNSRLPLGVSLGVTEGYADQQDPILAHVVRDLTMPKTSQPIYKDPQAPVLVHDPIFNRILSSKSEIYDRFLPVQPLSIPRVPFAEIDEAIASIHGKNVVVKPDYGSAGEGVNIGKKAEVVAKMLESQTKSGLYIVQEAIDMSAGIPSLGVAGVHNLRLITIGGEPTFGFVRDDPSGSLTMQGETFENRVFLSPDQVEEIVGHIFRETLGLFRRLPGALQSVVALDFIVGKGSNGETGARLLEVNRRPLRNSPYDDRSPETMRAAEMWDNAEARMLSGVVALAKGSA